MAQLLEEAETIAANMKDEYTSTEHLLMAMASARNGNVRQLLERNGIDYSGIMQGLAKARGSQRVTNQTPEAQYDALVKYGRDLTAEAGKGNLDPIIGRDQVAEGAPATVSPLSEGIQVAHGCQIQHSCQAVNPRLYHCPGIDPIRDARLRDCGKSGTIFPLHPPRAGRSRGQPDSRNRKDRRT